MKKTINVVYGFIALLICSILFRVVLNEFDDWQKMHTYYTANIDAKNNAQIIQSEVRRTPIRKSARGYRIKYSYIVNGQEYTSSLVNFSRNYEGVAYKYHHRYPVGAEVVVFYDSSDPSVSVLEKEPIGIGVFFGVFCYFFVLFFFSFMLWIMLTELDVLRLFKVCKIEN